jgi:formate hydrogenlyase transcriptional activator
LQNLIERAVVLSPGPVLRLDRTILPAIPSDADAMTSEALGDGPPKSGQVPHVSHLTPDPVAANCLTLEEVERGHILVVLTQTRGVIEGPKGAAKILKLHPNTLRSRIKKLGIKHSDYDIS